MSPSVEAEFRRIEKRYFDAIIVLIGRSPADRIAIAYSLLGQAVAMCDTFGIDVNDFLLKLRAVEPMPDVLVPPARQQS